MKNISSICTDSTIKSLCLGKFDGVHIAHQRLFEEARACDGGVLAIDIDHPPYLTPHQGDLISLPFYQIKLETIKEMGAREFASFLNIHFPKVKKIIVGYDFRFGKNRLYTSKDLEEFFDVCVIEKIGLDGIAIHRQTIIQALQEGKIKQANAMLGRNYSIEGRVVRGQGIGQRECVATLNLEIGDLYVLPKDGVYASWSEIDGMKYKSVSFIGHRLSSDSCFAIETHLLDKCLDKCKSNVKIYFVEFLRENQRFDSLALLKEQITQDISQAKMLLT